MRRGGELPATQFANESVANQCGARDSIPSIAGAELDGPASLGASIATPETAAVTGTRHQNSRKVMARGASFTHPLPESPRPRRPRGPRTTSCRPPGAKLNNAAEDLRDTFETERMMSSSCCQCCICSHVSHLIADHENDRKITFEHNPGIRERLKMRVNGNLLSSYQRQTVCLLGRVLQSEVSGMSLKLESPDKQVVQVIMKKPVSAQPPSGDRGLVVGVADREQGDMETYNRLVELMNERKEYYPTMASC
ncbi:hypothetical protein IscW_ISCW006303 [Ixodes scapularis]|uniref:Uncharacterized protein n=1 Tax=Ixodes scapularis TaxID=6945 RepID=B7PLH3_IXOSC|nr:hypothetical protein IscW_ISCW006303 [Ixodes scapularis]|eukprot:XP_002434621.1 hypothetical protein IscW_ISCW006303 [Ixodes scapularis]